MVVLAVTWIAKNGQEQRAADLFRELERESRKEPGCLMYIVHCRTDRPGEFFIYEQYRDQAALDAHRATPHFLGIARGSLSECAERKDGALFSPIS